MEPRKCKSAVWAALAEGLRKVNGAVPVCSMAERGAGEPMLQISLKMVGWKTPSDSGNLVLLLDSGL